MSVKNCFLKMPKYAGLFRKMPVNASGMDFTHKCRHFPNPALTGLCNLQVKNCDIFHIYIFMEVKIVPNYHKLTHHSFSEGACILTQEKDGCILFSWDDVTEWSEVRLLITCICQWGGVLFPPT